MTGAATIVAYGLLGAIVWRLRGGAFGYLVRKYVGFEPGTTLTRLGAMAMLSLPMFAFLPWYHVLAFWLAAYGASVIGYYGEAMSANNVKEIALMSGWGLTITGIHSVALLSLSPSVFFGLMAGLIYWACRKLEHKLPTWRRAPWFLSYWTEYAEAIFGLMVGLHIGLMLVE